MYWTDMVGGDIYCSNLDGSNVKKFVDAGGNAIDLALDTAGGKIYWTETFHAFDYSQGGLMRANLDGSDIELLTEDTINRNPRGIALDLGRNKVYWADESFQSIHRADLDGRNERIIVSESYTIHSPTDIILDVDEGKLYWGDHKGSIHRADLDGENGQEVLTGLTDFSIKGIAFDLVEDKIYWTDGARLQRADLEGKNTEHLAELEDANVIYYYDLELYRFRVEVGWVLSGFNNDIDLDVDGRKLYWTDRKGRIQRADLDGENREVLFDPVVRAPHGLALSEGKMYWTDLVKGTIQRANLDGTDIELLITGIRHPRGISISGGGKIYWVDSGGWDYYENPVPGKIQVANLDGTDLDDIVTGISYPDDIALDVLQGRIYWTALWDHAIRRVELDGSDAEDILTAEGRPRGISLDLDGGKLYWTEDNDIKPSKIRRSNLDGTNIEDIVSGYGSSSGGIALDPVGNRIYWMVYWAPPRSQTWGQMFWSNLDGTNPMVVEEEGTGTSGGARIALYIPRPTSVSTPGSPPESPTTTGLFPNYPNPFNASTQIAYRLATPGLVRLTVYNTLGQPVRTLVNQLHSAGFYQVPWDARDQKGAAVGTGVYFARMHYTRGVETRRLLFIK